MTGPTGGAPRPGVLRRGARLVRWYVREATGEAAYDRYAERAREAGGEVLSRREFELRRMRRKEHDPRQGFRCC